MDEFAFFFDSSQIIEEVHVIEPPRRRVCVLLPFKKRPVYQRVTECAIYRDRDMLAPRWAQGP